MREDIFCLYLEPLQRYQDHLGFCKWRFAIFRSYRCRYDGDEFSDIVLHNAIQNQRRKLLWFFDLLSLFIFKHNLRCFAIYARSNSLKQKYNVCKLQPCAVSCHLTSMLLTFNFPQRKKYNGVRSGEQVGHKTFRKWPTLHFFSPWSKHSS
jgi:hypothetical protein